MSEIEKVKNWFRQSVRNHKGEPYVLDDEQTAAVIDDHFNVLVSARAGSGKTHTLVAKIIYMVAEHGYRPSQIMAFVFNKKAAVEINERLEAITVDGRRIVPEDSNVARTFHAFAYQVIRFIDGRGSFGKILVDGERGADTDKSRTLYIQDIISHIRNSDQFVRDGMYDFFRREMGRIETVGFDSPEEYYRAIRNDHHLTLDGRSVKSYGEKIIADFFFEHGIEYKYEPEYYPKSFVKKNLCRISDKEFLKQEDLVKADFFLTKERLVWEHWAITGHEDVDTIAGINRSEAIGDYYAYLRKMKWKQWFYSKAWLCDDHTRTYKDDPWYGYGFADLVESHKPHLQSREGFEDELARICRARGVRMENYSHEDLVQRAWKKQVKLFTRMVIQFVDRTQQQFYDSIEDLAVSISEESSHTIDEARTKVFHQIGLKVYEDYLRRLKLRGDNGLVYVNRDNQWEFFGDYGADFSMLLQRSKELLRQGEVDQVLKPLEVKSILVDEFQDFSRLFYDNLQALRTIFPESTLFCVGDDWQSINRFAGADSKYFEDFEDIFPKDSTKLLISNNYRSAPEIVDNANHVMQRLLGVNYSQFAKAANKNRGQAIIQAIDLGGVSLDDMPDDMRGRAALYRYVITISRLIVKHRGDERIVILHRNNKMLINFSVWGVMRYMVREYVTSTLKAMIKPEFDEKIKFLSEDSNIMTAHRSKGLEGDTVILLEVDPKTFPSSDGRNALFALFGDTPESHQEDEVHLYYVALTRAKRNLYVLWGTYPHNPNDVPEYIKVLDQTE